MAYLFDTLEVFLKLFLKKLILKNFGSADDFTKQKKCTEGGVIVNSAVYLIK